MSPAPRRAVVALGASLGDRAATLALAVRMLDGLEGLAVERRSRLFRSPPAGGVARNWFLNAAVLVRTRLDPQALFAACKALEARLGRGPGLRWGDRVVDLDLVWVDGVVLDGPDLTLPHPRIAARPFVVLPLEDVLPGALDPRSGRPLLAEHLARGPAAALPRPVPVGLLPTPRRRRSG